ncbi:FHA domain-containing protein [Flagellatimonas centrodinii]|uniref:FHA domain-containing protein n=1 Tax=Flagellatimonas centrodinii TaxID=2806210 RepID=UPI001FEEF6B0|nr:FHA domain-containing protein [Flagellatimonas centrodinii]ULQ47211.1 FHA domain-containing protein [Flagellatimonas centrodinii]
MSATPAVLLLAEFSNPMRERRGEPVADDLALRKLSAIATERGGQQLQSLPRQLLFRFGGMPAAYGFGRQLVSEVAGWLHTGDRSEVRVVVGAGPVTLDQGRVRGDWVHRLAGVMPRVPEGAIAAFATAAAMDPSLPPAAGLRRLADDLYMLFPSHTPEAAETRMASPLEAEGGMFTEITLRVRGGSRSFRSAECPLIVGRSSESTVQVAAERASRLHGRVIYEHGRFYYVDESRNGTWVLTGSGEEVHLENDRLLLTGEGALSLGSPIGQQSGEVVRFICRSKRLRMDADIGDTRPLDR